MIRVGLSLDFDFFCYEDPSWDFGHTEISSIYQSSAVWALRYVHYDLERLSNIDKADFYPLDIFNQLKDRNLTIMDNAIAGFADSHKHAYDFFASYGDDIDLIINIDAHHDCWYYDDNSNIDGANWLTALRKKAIWVYPSWKNPELDENPYCDIEKIRWTDFDMKEENRVIAMFVCRSSAWVPPHYDVLYSKFVERISDRLYPKILQGVNPREDIDYQALAAQRIKLKKEMDAINTQSTNHTDEA